MGELPPEIEQTPGPEQEPPVEAYEQFLDEYDAVSRRQREATEAHVAHGGSTEVLNRDHLPSAIQEREEMGRVARERLHKGDFGLVGRLISGRLGKEYEDKAAIIAALENDDPLYRLSDFSRRYYANWLNQIDSTVKRLTPLEQYALKRYIQLREQYRREHCQAPNILNTLSR